MLGKKSHRRKRLPKRPGARYREIIVERELIDEEKEELFTKKENRYVRFCKKLHSIAPSLGEGAEWPEEYKDAMAFLNWNLSAEEFAAASKLVLILAIILSVLAGVLILNAPVVGELFYSLFRGVAPVMALGLFLVVSLGLWWYMQQYPFGAVLAEQRKALSYVPELVGYLVMSMKLSPNLEKASEFAADHGRGKIADDFKKLLWNLELGVYNNLSEGLDEIAYTWGKYSKEFKRAIMRIRASVLENSDSKRDAILDKTMEDLLGAIREKMESYARELKQPSIVLFYIGVLLPIILIIILPIGSAFTNAPFATAPGLITIYNIIIPLLAFVYARQIIKNRPPTYEVPEIPEDYPGLPEKGKIKLRNGQVSIKAVILIIVVFGGAFSWFLHTDGFPPKTLLSAFGGEEMEPFIAPDRLEERVVERNFGDPDYFKTNGPYYQWLKKVNPRWGEKRIEQELVFERKKFFIKPGNDITPYNLIFGILLTASACIFVWFYFNNIYKRKVQKKIMEIESEFKDSLYIIASRLGENKPLEDAIKHARDFLPNYLISDRVFGRTLDNIHLLGMPIDSAVFDPRFGSLVNIPSNSLKVGMRLVIDSVRLGVNIAARTLVSLSLQLSNQEKVAKMLKNLIVDLTQMMRTMAIFITPIVLGITTALYMVVIRTLIRISTSRTMMGLEQSAESAESTAFGGFAAGNWAKPEAVLSMVGPEVFVLIIALYVAQIVFIVIYFTTKIEEDNELLMKLYLAKYLPLAIIMFTLSVMLSNILLNSFSVIG